MTELPTFYGWLLRIGILAVIVGLFYLGRYINKSHPFISNYIVLPLLLVLVVAELIILIITQ